MGLVPLQHASFSPPQRRSLLPSGLRACHGALRRLHTRQGALASVEARAQAATAAGAHAIDGGTAVSMPSAAMSDGSRAPAARVVVATNASQPAATRPPSLPWCCAEARHSMPKLSERGSSCSIFYSSRRARHCWWLQHASFSRPRSVAACCHAASEPAMVLCGG